MLPKSGQESEPSLDDFAPCCPGGTSKAPTYRWKIRRLVQASRRDHFGGTPKRKRRQGSACAVPLSGRDNWLPDASRGLPHRRARRSATVAPTLRVPPRDRRPPGSLEPEPASGGPAPHARPTPGPVEPARSTGGEHGRHARLPHPIAQDIRPSNSPRDRPQPEPRASLASATLAGPPLRATRPCGHGGASLAIPGDPGAASP